MDEGAAGLGAAGLEEVAAGGGAGWAAGCESMLKPEGSAGGDSGRKLSSAAAVLLPNPKKSAATAAAQQCMSDVMIHTSQTNLPIFLQLIYDS